MLHLGVCVPSACTNDEIQDLAQYYLDNQFLDSQPFIESQPKVVSVKDLKLSAQFYEKTSLKIVM